MSKYIMACDERGTRSWPSSSNTWAFGGFIIKKSNLYDLYKVWDEIKLSLCGRSDVEMKWSHFFEGRHQEKGNPLKSIGEQNWRNDLLFALDKLCEVKTFTPVTTITRKNLIPQDEYKHYFDESQKGNLLLQDYILKVHVYGLFALYLKRVNSFGNMWMDNLGSEKEQMRLQEIWTDVRDSDIQKKHYSKNYRMTRKIGRKISFFDSSDEPAIQLADFISGVIWAAAEGDEEFLLKFEKTYMFSSILGEATLVKSP